ncbi:MAG: uroporphyrinogen-III synthase [Pseudomonadota bacterium]
MPPTILITRPQDAADRLAELLRARLGRDVTIVISPLMKIEARDEVPPLDRIKTLVFTSVHAVRAFAAMSKRRDFACYAVGDATARAAEDAGFAAITGPGTGADLVTQIAKSGPDTPCLYLRGEHVAYDVAKALNSAGIETCSAVVYRQTSLPLNALARDSLSGANMVIAPLFSPRSAKLFCDEIPPGRNVFFAAMSEAVARVIPSNRADRIDVAKCPDIDAMVDAIAALWSRANQLEGDGPAQ